MFIDPRSLADRELAAHEATHLGEHPAAFFVLGPADGPVGVRVEVFHAQAVAGPQGHHADPVGRHSHRVGHGRGRRALDRRAPQDLLVTLGQARERDPHQGMVDTRAGVVCRRCRSCCLKTGVLGRHDSKITTGMVDGDGPHCRQEVGPEVGQWALADPNEVVDPKARCGHDILGRGAAAVAVGHGIRGGQMATPQLAVGVRVPCTHQPEQGGVISVDVRLTPDNGWRGHDPSLLARLLPLTDAGPLCL